jgi:hypothetical protein
MQAQPYLYPAIQEYLPQLDLKAYPQKLNQKVQSYHIHKNCHHRTQTVSD